MSVIRLQDIQTIYEGEKLPVIYDINLEVNQGDFICIIGPNGAGKTTLLETINGLLDYRSGSGFVLGMDISKKKTNIRRQLGYVIQNFELDPLAPFLCKDIVMSGRTGKIGLMRFSGKKDWEKVWQSMSLVGMIDFAKRPIGKLSGGEFQKIILARALAQEPKILLLDEPFSNLDYSARNQIEILLNRLNEKQKMTILMVSHDLSFIPNRCSRIIVLDRGRIILDGEKNKILKSKVIKQLYSKEEGGS